MRLQGILWDNDGVLVDTERLFYQANRELFLPFGVDLSERDFYHWYLADHCGAWHFLQAATAAGLRCIVLRNALTEHAAFPGAWRIVDDVAELHAELAALAKLEP